MDGGWNWREGGRGLDGMGCGRWEGMGWNGMGINRGKGRLGTGSGRWDRWIEFRGYFQWVLGRRRKNS